MTGRIVSGLLTVAVVLGASVGSAAARDLTFEERIRAQEAIERVYFSHQTGSSWRNFEQFYTQELLTRKVRTYLAQSAALESIWKTPVTSEMLQRELERMARQTKMPERLQELYQALGNDSFVLQECLARPALVDRMSRSFFATDSAIHAGTRRSAEEIHALLESHRLDPWTSHPNRTEFHLVRVDASQGNRTSPSDEERSDEREGRAHVDLQPDEFARWDAILPEKAGQIGPLVEEREAFVVRSTLERRPGEVRTVSYAIKKRDWDSWWQGIEGDLNPLAIKAVAEEGRALPQPLASQAAALDSAVATPSSSLSSSLTLATAPTAIADDTWDNGSFYSVPDPRFHHTAIWTGSLMVIWGGFNSGAYLDTGAKYDPVIDTWTPTSMVKAPSPRGLHSAVWVPPEDPAGDPIGKMIIWGGYFPRKLQLADGSTAFDFKPLGDGMEYLPDLDAWISFDAGASGTPPGLRYGHMAVWVPTADPTVALGKMIIWGGVGFDRMPDKIIDSTPDYLGTGAIFDENLLSWVPIATIGAPLPRWQGAAVWSDDKFIVWGGFGVTQYLKPLTDPPTLPVFDVLQTGGIYDPTTDTWAATSLAGAPTARQDVSAVWSGGNARMVIWGGIGRSASGQGSTTLGDGALFNPAANSWSAMATTGAPGRRYFHSTVWTGSDMLVWGGLDGTTGTYLNSGGRYNPVSNSWSAISGINAPSPRFRHTAVWTGSMMIVWGGSITDDFHIGASLDTGGRYDFATDSWTPTVTGGSAPVRRSGHTAVWTGSRMVVWGGRDRMIPADYNTGSRYDPTTDQWSPISTNGAPSARSGQGAVWWTDGGQMLIWGGRSTQPPGSTPPYLYLNSGGRYDPGTDSWTTMSSGTNVPDGRFQHSTIWTGSEMVVWGGSNPTNLGTGGRYNPATDTWKATSTIGGDLTLDAQGDPNAVFIFQIASTLAATDGRQVILKGGARAANVFWQVGHSAILGTGSVFKGNILALDSITVRAGAAVEGRLLARTAAVTLDSNVVGLAIPPDVTRPTVTVTSPVNAATGVAINQTITAAFSEAMNPGTFSTASFTLKRGATAVAGTVTYAGVTAFFAPAGNLVPLTTYTATMTSAAKDLAGNALAANFVWSFTTAAPAAGQALVALGSAATFAVLAGTTVTNTGATTVNGDLGLSPGRDTAVTGFPPGIVNGTIHANDPAAIQAQLDLKTAYNDAAGRTVGAITVAGDLGGQTLTPGLYISTSSLAISSGDLTLDAQGDPNAVFIFQIASTLTTTVGRQVILSGGARAANVFWQVGSSATLEAGSVFKGNILALDSITVTTGAAVEGRLLARTAAVTLDSNVVGLAIPADITPPTVTVTAPVNAATGVAINQTITAAFSEAMDPLTFSSATFTLKQGATAVAGTVTYFGVTAFFAPAGNLAPLTAYTATMTTAAKDLAGNALISNFVWSFTTAAPAAGQALVALGSATTFAVLAGSTVTNTRATTVNGDLGLSPGTAVTGFPPGIVNGTIHAGDPAAAQAQLDLTTAYNDLAGRTVGAITVSGNLGGQTLTPGLYKSTSSLAISSTPDPRQQHTAVWTGNEMIVWGGTVSSQVNSGGRYNPATDSWVSTSTVVYPDAARRAPENVPEKRSQQAAVWTGSRMVIWGGWLAVTDANGLEKNEAGNTGSRYEPVTDTWAAMTTQNAPPAALAPSYVWTGSQFLAWSGSTLLSGPYVSTGGRYDPAADRWTAMSRTNAPSPRVQASTVWTGNLMLTWGGFNGAPMSSGGRYSSLSGSTLSTFFLDQDGDGIGDPSLAIQGYSAPAGYVAGAGADCNDADLSTWSTPSEVPSLSCIDASGMNWMPPSVPGATSVGYDLLRTGNPADFVSASTCVSTGTLVTSAIDGTVPSPGQVFYYLVRARNGCPNGSGVGVLGFDSAGNPRQGRTCQ